MGLYNRQNAVDYLLSCMRTDPLSGYQLVIDQKNFLNPNFAKVFLFNQCAITAEVFRRLGYNTEKTSISNAMHYHLDAKYNPTWSAFQTIVDSSIFPSTFSDRTSNDLWFQHTPYLITSNYAITLTPTSDVTTMPVNRALLRCIHSYQVADNTDALACWDVAMGTYDGFSIGYDAANGRYTSYMLFLQNYTAALTGFTWTYGAETITYVRPNHANSMQETDPTKGYGKIRQFYTGTAPDTYTSTGINGNTETTALCVLADIMRNGV